MPEAPRLFEIQRTTSDKRRSLGPGRSVLKIFNAALRLSGARKVATRGGEQFEDHLQLHFSADVDISLKETPKWDIDQPLWQAEEYPRLLEEQREVLKYPCNLV